jgi:hypothetical protein
MDSFVLNGEVTNTGLAEMESIQPAKPVNCGFDPGLKKNLDLIVSAASTRMR